MFIYGFNQIIICDKKASSLKSNLFHPFSLQPPPMLAWAPGGKGVILSKKPPIRLRVPKRHWGRVPGILVAAVFLVVVVIAVFAVVVGGVGGMGS